MQQIRSEEPAPASGSAHRPWKTFPLPARQLIEDMLAERATPTCPLCGGWLGARPRTRIRSVLPAANGCCDLECDTCRRFHPVLPEDVRHMYRVRRLATAVMRA